MIQLWISVAVVVISLLFFLLKRRNVCKGRSAGKVRPPIQDILSQNLKDIKYDLKDLKSPKLTGYLFHLLVKFGLTRLGSITLMPDIARKSNLYLMGGEYIPEKPTLYPKFKSTTKDNGKLLNDKVLQILADQYVADTSGTFHHYTSLDYYQAYNSCKCTPSDVIQAVLDAIQLSNQTNPPLRAVIETDKASVLATAEASTERWKKGQPLSILDGVPIAFKAEFKVKPYSFKGGATFIPSCCKGLPESPFVKKFQDAGAIIIGITNMQEFGTGTLGSNPHKEYLTPRNPYNTLHYPGGSSSGSACSVAAGLCPIAMGVDGGGSIRIPAGLCGVSGLKPTAGLFDNHGIVPLTYSVGVPGPLGASIFDLALTMNIIGSDESRIDLEEFGKEDLNGIKIGIYTEYFEHADKEIVAQCKKAVQEMVALGAEVHEIVIPELEEMKVSHAITISSEMCSSLAVDMDKKSEQFNDESLFVLAFGYKFSATEYINAQKQRTRSLIILEKIFEKVDVIITPLTACVAPLIPPGAEKYGYGDAKLMGHLMRFVYLANLAGIPGVTVPVGMNSEGLPIGLQLIGNGNCDGHLLRVAYSLEKQVLSKMTKPKIYFDILGKFL